MGTTRRAARIGFAALLIGAGAAAVSARPTSAVAGVELEIVQGDPRLDLAWALSQQGMSSSDAKRVSVLLVDQVDPEGELEALTASWAVEFWWRAERLDGPPVLQMMRGRIGFQLGNALRQGIAQSGCGDSGVPFVVLRASGDPALPFAADATVLVRVLDAWTSAGPDPIPSSAFRKFDHRRAAIECQPVSLDPDFGVAVPTRWPGN